MGMLPLFKSDFSIGKSILTLNHPDKSLDGGSDSIFEIAQSNGLKEVILVENCLTGFLQAIKNSEDLGIQLIFGLSLIVCNDLSQEPKANSRQDESNIIVFAKNGSGCKLLNKIYSKAFTEGYGRIDYKNLKKIWEPDVFLYIPFYDSFIFKNAMGFNNCTPELSFTEPTFFIEENGLPFDSLIREKVLSYCEKNNLKTETAKSIYYKSRDDFAAYQTYKCICNRKYGSADFGLVNPKLEHCGSKEFSFESWKEKNDEIS